MPEREIKVFYSWQSDLPNSTTRGLIQNSIEAAVRNMRDTVEVTADRDTQGVYGSPDIVETIFLKLITAIYLLQMLVLSQHTM